MKKTLTCTICENFNFSSGTLPYSSLTPGEDWSISCKKGIYYLYGEDISKIEFHECITKADICKFYKEV